jgi:hypothetical protein
MYNFVDQDKIRSAFALLGTQDSAEPDDDDMAV